MSSEKPIVPIDLNQTIRERLIQRYGHNVGKRLIKVIQDCIAKHKGAPVDKKTLKQCIIDNLGKDESGENIFSSNPGDITDGNLNQILMLFSIWATVG
ncbi:MAG: hypothetical protein ACFE9C_08165 [Candidatus Hodarchaeota archaeon]